MKRVEEISRGRLTRTGSDRVNDYDTLFNGGFKSPDFGGRIICVPRTPSP